MELWWLPSVIVFGGATLLIVVGVKLARRRELSRPPSRGAVGPLRAPLAELERDAGVALVRADDALASARDELGFAAAQFGEDSVQAFTNDVQGSADELREAFRLRQRLDDHEPESDAKRRELSLRISSLCAEIQKSLSRHSAQFRQRRQDEVAAPERLADLRGRLAVLQARMVSVQSALGEARAEYDPAVLQGAVGALASAAETLDRASAAIADAQSAADAARPAGESVVAVEQHLILAERQLDDAAGTLEDAHSARARLAEAAEALSAAIGPARSVQTSSADPDFAARVGAAAEAASALLRELDGQEGPARSRHPVRELQRLDAARDALEAALAAARNQEARLAGAREALAGALRVAESQVESARRLIDGNRQRVGASSRTRLAEAERQLAIARDLADPVEALDTARQSARFAEDAIALARYDLG